MLAQVVTRLEKTSIKACPNCKEFPIEVYSLQLQIHDVEGSVDTEGHLACLECLLGSGERVIAKFLRVSDVIKTSRTPQKNMLKKVRRQERETADDIDGRTTPASGSGISKGDIRNGVWFGENKSSFKGDASYRLTGETMLKALHQAQKLGLRPFVQVRLQRSKLDLVVLLWQDFLEAIHGNG
jgi:hypothetical protein